MDCEVFEPTGDAWLEMAYEDDDGDEGEEFSEESEFDLAMMVSDFLENGSCMEEASESDSEIPDLDELAERISYLNTETFQSESDLLSIVNSLVLSINETDLHLLKSDLCNASCIRFSLVKLMRLSGFDAGVCASKWQGKGKVPGGDHEYVDVINYNDDGSSERLIIDIDFRSHFEIARAVEGYDKVLNSLPVIYAGNLTKLKQLLRVMVEAARFSLEQNSMPLPPWRSLAYLKAKWQSPYERKIEYDESSSSTSAGSVSEHKQCRGHLKRLQASLRAEVELEYELSPKPVNRRKRRVKRERRRPSPSQDL